MWYSISQYCVLKMRLRYNLAPMTLDSIKQELRQERDRLNAAIRALEGLAGVSTQSTNGRRKRRTLSAAARRRIGAAQRARWAKWKARKG